MKRSISIFKTEKNIKHFKWFKKYIYWIRKTYAHLENKEAILSENFISIQ